MGDDISPVGLLEHGLYFRRLGLDKCSWQFLKASACPKIETFHT